MKVYIVTLFPEVFTPFVSTSIIGRAKKKGALELHFLPLRDFGVGKHRQVDDYPYGGGRGMILKPEPFFYACRRITETEGAKPWTLLFTPAGKLLNQQRLVEYARLKSMVLLCGHYEGVDERIALHLADEEVSIGNYITSGGESVAIVFLDAIVRLLPGVLSNEAKQEESFSGRLLEYPQYTRPETFEGHSVPEVLLSGDHARIKAWREAQARERTKRNRPDLYRGE